MILNIVLYLRYTRSPLYSFLFTIPLFIIYEVGLFLSQSDDLAYMRNGADALMRQILSMLGINGFYWIGGLFLVCFIVIYFFQKYSWEDYELNFKYLIIMAFETFFWSYLLYFAMLNMHVILMIPSGPLVIQKVTLAIGAGIYEEILFRVILIYIFKLIIGSIFNWENYSKVGLAMIIAAAIFSSFHFIGEFGDYFSFNLFMVRFLAGIILGLLYIFRGFGITAWSHSIYDLIILTRITTQ